LPPVRDETGAMLSEIALRLPKLPKENMLKAKGIETLLYPL
jgi:hypothetical protein